MEYPVPDELKDFFTEATESELPSDEGLRRILAGLINEHLSPRQQGKSTLSHYKNAVFIINDWIERNYPGKRELTRSYLRDLATKPILPWVTTKWQTDLILPIYLALTEFRDENPEKLSGNEEKKESNNFKKIKENLLEGAVKFYEELVCAGLVVKKIEEVLLPKLCYNTKVVEDEAPLHRVLKDCWKEELSKSFVLIGNGGAGKSTSLFYLWQMLLRQEKILPIYIPLKEKELREDQKDFIFWFIVRNYLGKHQAEPSHVNELWDFIQTPSTGKMPRVLLLLDGLNELVEGKGEVFSELDHWQRKGVSFQVIITSRTDIRQSHICFKEYSLLEAEPLRQGQVDQYVRNNGGGRKITDSLKRILSNPLMLTLYLQTDTTIQSRSEHLGLKMRRLHSQSDVFWNFLQSHLAKYSEANREFHRVKFILFHLFPLIAHRAFVHNRQIISRSDMEKFIAEGTNQFKDSVFREAFPEYYDHIHSFKLDRPLELCAECKVLLSDTFALLKQKDGGFYFFHQNFRDFLAGLHVVDTLRYFVQSKGQDAGVDLPSEVKEDAWPLTLRKWIWENSCEDALHNDLLERVLDACRGIFESTIVGRTILNIINTLEGALPDLAEIDFRSLCLLDVPLNGVKLYRDTEAGRISVSFENSLISANSFIPRTYGGKTWGLGYDKSGNRLVTGSSDGTVNVWEMSSRNVLFSWFHREPVWKTVFHPKEDTVLLSDECGKLYEYHVNENSYGIEIDTKSKLDPWNHLIGYSLDGDLIGLLSIPEERIRTFSRSGQEMTDTDDHKNFLFPMFSSTGMHVSKDANGNLLIVNTDSDEIEKTLSLREGAITASIRPDGKAVAVSFNDGIQEFNIETQEETNFFRIHSSWAQYCSYSPCGQKIIICTDRCVQEWDTTTGILIREFEAQEAGIVAAVYNSDGNTIAVVEKTDKVHLWNLKTGAVAIMDLKDLIPQIVSSKPGAQDFYRDKYLYGLPKEYASSVKREIASVSYSESLDTITSIMGRPLAEFINWSKARTIFCRDERRDFFFLSVSPDRKRVVGQFDMYHNVVAEWDVESGKILRKYFFVSGVHVAGCSFRNLNPKSDFSDKWRKHLTSYGAYW